MKRFIYAFLLVLLISFSHAQVIREMKFENVKLETVLKALSEVSQMNLVFDPAISQDLQKTVSVAIYKPVPVGEAFNIILKENNLIAVPVDKKVYRITKAGSISVSVVGLDEREVNEVINFLKARVSPSAEIVWDKTLKTIYVRDEEANIKKLEPVLKDYRRLAQALVPREEIQTKVFYLKFIDLDEAEKRIKPHTSQDTLITKAYDFNALVIRDTPKRLEEYEKILKPFLTTTPSERRPVTKIFYLKYVSPEEFIKMIEPYRSEAGQVLSGGALVEKERVDEVRTEVAGKTTREEVREKPAGPVPVIREFNAVMITDYPDVIQRIKEIFKEYISDTPVRISIEARIVEISSEALRELGINWNALLSQARVPQFWQGGASANMGLPPNTAGSPLLVPGLSPNPGGLFVFTYQKGMLNALNLRISALERINKARSIAKPMVVAINGQKAIIKQGIQVPYLTASPGPGATAVQNVQFKDVVLELDVTPIVSPDGRILIDLTLRRDTVGIQTPQGPAINTREVKTKIVVESGQTAVLGGIIDSQDSQTNEGLPGLVRVPILKYLFGQEKINIADRELLIFITPTLLTQ
ncbi:MAG: pilus assembly protein [Aquificota bacterium]|jgi:type IV pilus assembly protein PilQ|nr:MAG: pilus assembly protein [Aquificota bacterium]